MVDNKLVDKIARHVALDEFISLRIPAFGKAGYAHGMAERVGLGKHYLDLSLDWESKKGKELCFHGR
jgi:hypothetical protein